MCLHVYLFRRYKLSISCMWLAESQARPFHILPSLRLGTVARSPKMYQDVPSCKNQAQRLLFFGHPLKPIPLSQLSYTTLTGCHVDCRTSSQIETNSHFW